MINVFAIILWIKVKFQNQIQIEEGESLRFRVKFYPPHPDIHLKASILHV